MTTRTQPPAHQPGNIGQARTAARSMFDPTIVRPALVDSFRKLAPRTQLRNPVMFCVYVGSILTTILWFAALGGQAEAPAGFILAIALWLWFTVLFANFAEAARRPRPRRCAAPSAM
jgi:K+-transporting ATPase ATPase B chain